jgi:O-antigen ligase
LDQADLTTGRMQIWIVVFEQLKNHPWLGYGFNATGIITQDLPQEGPWPVLKGPLNLFIGISGEAGLLGLSALFWLLGGSLWQCAKIIYTHFQYKDDVFYFAFFLFIILLGMAAQQNGEWQVLRVTPFNFLFFFFVSAAWSLSKNAVDIYKIS